MAVTDQLPKDAYTILKAHMTSTSQSFGAIHSLHTSWFYFILNRKYVLFENMFIAKAKGIANFLVHD